MSQKREELFELLCEVGQYGIEDMNTEVEEELFWIDNIEDLTEDQSEQVISRVQEITSSYVSH